MSFDAVQKASNGASERRGRVTVQIVGLLAVVLLMGLGVQAGYAQPTVTFDSIFGDVFIAVGPGMQRQSATAVADVEVIAGANYDIEVEVQPSAGWTDVDMNTNHHAIGNINDYVLGFDVALTTGGERPGDPGKAAWAMGRVTRENEAQTITDWQVHVRLVLVDEDGKTAAFRSGEDNVRFVSLPAGTDREVNVVVTVTEE